MSIVVGCVLLAGTMIGSTRVADSMSWPEVRAEDARCGGPARDPLPAAGQPITATLAPAPPLVVGRVPASAWQRTPVADLGWKLRFQGLSWLRSLAVRAHAEGRADVLEALVDQVVAFHRQNPDPGSVKHGWDEGTAMRRLETENCLFTFTRSARLVPGMVADASVQLGKRYYGPPYRAVHNHGLMACIQLVRAADLLHRADWKRTALHRMSHEAPRAFSPAGTSYEQASGYQQFNADQWARAADVLAASPGTSATVAKIRETVDKAYRMAAWMTQPDGTIVQFGDSTERTGHRMDLSPARAVRDDKAGLIAGRWSWTDPQTAHYTVRYGPARRAHGHRDQSGAVTFMTRGVKVLVGPGRHSYNRDDPFWIYQMTPQATNVAVPAPGFVSDRPGRVTSTEFGPLRHTVTVEDEIFQAPHTRTITVDPASMTVSDTYRETTEWRQSWHLDPKWTLVSLDPAPPSSNPAGLAPGPARFTTDPSRLPHTVTRLIFRHAGGRQLTVTTTGHVEALQHGLKGDVTAGWHFPKEGQSQPAYQLTIRNNGPECTTRFEIDPADPPTTRSQLSH